MIKKTPYLVVGLLLIALSALWFFTSIGSTLLDTLGIVPMHGMQEGGSDEYAFAVMALNFLNTVFAGLGALFAALSLRKAQ
jgi:hypothetical protein